MKIINPLNNETMEHTLILNQEQKYLSNLFDF